MSFLKNAIRNGISEGIGKGIGDAVGKAAEKIVAPKAEAYANKVASQLDEATSAMEGTAATVKDTAAQSSGSGFASLETALGGWKESAERYATAMSKNFKHCANCGEDVPADRKFCPECGAPLPETTIADDTVCPKCGKQNVVGTKFCADCGTKLPGWAAEEAAEMEQAAKEEAAMRAAEEEEMARRKALEDEAKAKAAAAKSAVLDGAKEVGNMLGGFFKKR